jgi:hypothetical protein
MTHLKKDSSGIQRVLFASFGAGLVAFGVAMIVELFQHFAQTQVHAFEIGPRRQPFFSALEK